MDSKSCTQNIRGFFLLYRDKHILSRGSCFDSSRILTPSDGSNLNFELARLFRFSAEELWLGREQN